MDNEMTMKIEAKLDSTEIANSAKHKICMSSSSSSESIDIEKDQIVVETKKVDQEGKGNDASEAAELIETKHKENASISSQASSAITSQMAVQGGGGAYDPNRIPASVFTSKAGTPMDWSVASNESLFSITMGNTSFSKDHVFMMYRSGEMPKFEFDQATNPFSGANTPPIPPEHIERKSMEVTKNNSDSTIDHAKQIPQPELAAAAAAAAINRKSVSLDPEKIALPEKSVSVAGDDFRNSSSSTHSFQFPLLEVGGGTSMRGATGNLHSPPKRPANENGELQQAKSVGVGEGEAEAAQPQAASAPAKRSTWLSFFACCSPPAN